VIRDSMKIDHVSIAWSSLGPLQKAFESVGLKTDYGGVHSNGITHMSLLAFDDGSYIELISTVKPGVLSPSWPKHIVENGGPCGWAMEVSDLAKEVKRIKNLGIPAIGPDDYYRKRPDGVLVEWQLAFLGDEEPGATLPFLIRDKTPRDYRVKLSPSVSSSGRKPGSSKLFGVEKVLLGVKDFEDAIELFRKIYGWKEPARVDENSQLRELFGSATLTDFEEAPVVLVSSQEKGNWLDNRLEKFGNSPCAFLIGLTDIAKTEHELDLSRSQPWVGKRRAAWIPTSKLNGIRLGFIDHDS
jgi:hypothetical protein